MKNKDLNKIAKIEKAIKEKYGEEAIQNPNGSWTEEKEKKYLECLKDFYTKVHRADETTQKEGFLIKNRKVKNHIDRNCPVCGSYSFSPNDDLYMTKFECCFECFIQFVEGREQRWNSGWRPNQ